MTDHDNQSRNLITVSPAWCLRLLFVVVVIVVIIGAAANFGIYHVAADPESNLAKVLRRADLGHEPSIPNFYSAVAMLVAAALLALIGSLEQSVERTPWHYWYAFSLIFFALAIDEAVLFHEMIDAAIHQRFETSGALFFPWVIVGGVFVIVVGAIFIPFVYKKSKRTFKLFMVAGAIFVAGAIGMEMVASLIFSQAGSEEAGVKTLAHTISMTIEEACEMLGMIVFIFALLDYLATQFPMIEIRFGGREGIGNEY